jgi:hypothetical protein
MLVFRDESLHINKKPQHAKLVILGRCHQLPAIRPQLDDPVTAQFPFGAKFALHNAFSCLSSGTIWGWLDNFRSLAAPSSAVVASLDPSALHASLVSRPGLPESTAETGA